MTPGESRALAILAQRHRSRVRYVTQWQTLTVPLQREGERLFAALYGSPINHNPGTVKP